jgi:hypothetical protein
LAQRNGLPLRFSFGPHPNSSLVRTRLVRRLSEILEERMREANEQFLLTSQALAARLHGRDIPAKGTPVSDLAEGDREKLLHYLNMTSQEQGFGSQDEVEQFFRRASIESGRPDLFLFFGFIDGQGQRSSIGIPVTILPYP